MAKFQGRFFIIDDCLTDLKCWVYEFDSMTDAKRSNEEWAEAHLQECYSTKEIRALLNLPEKGDLQVLFTADIDGKMSYGPDGDDYNEWLDVEKVAYQRVPEEFASYFTPQIQESTNDQEEHQSPESAIQGNRKRINEVVETIQLGEVAAKNVNAAIEATNKAEYRGLLAKDLSQAVSQGLSPTKCKECCGTGLNHPCSAKSRNTDDDTCPRCKGTGIEPTASIEQEQAARDARVNKVQSDYLQERRRLANEDLGD